MPTVAALAHHPAARAARVAVVSFLWPGPRKYLPRHVNAQGRALARCMTIPYRYVCFVEARPNDSIEYAAFDHDVVEVHPMPPAAMRLGHVKSPEGGQFPTSYRRLWLFSAAAAALADEVLLVDVDCVPCGPVAELVLEARRTGAPFCGWRPRSKFGTDGRLAGGTWWARTGKLGFVWDGFVANPAAAIACARGLGYRGSDQAYLSASLTTMPSWREPHGIYQAQDMRIKPGLHAPPEWPLPSDARLVHFNGLKAKPWTVPHWRWIRDWWDES